MRNQPPQSYYNDEMTVLLDSDTPSLRRSPPSPPRPNLFCFTFLSWVSLFCLKCSSPYRYYLHPLRVEVSCILGPSPPPHMHCFSLSRDDDLFFPQNIDPDYYESSRLLASTVLIEPDRRILYFTLSCSLITSHAAAQCSAV